MSKAKFNSKSTALEVIEGHDLTGYEVIVTGGNSGIGVETVRAFAKANARVILAARSLESARTVADEINKFVGKNNVEVELLDLASLKSVRDFVKRFLSKKRHLNILVANAGIMGCPFGHTEDGFELQFGTNHIGHFELFKGLLPALKEASQKTGKNSRLVVVSSAAHALTPVDFNDPNFASRSYHKVLSYGQSKTANILFAVEANKRYKNDGITANALMPGGISTGIQKHMTVEDYKAIGIDTEAIKNDPNWKTAEQGASTTIWAAVAPELENNGGLYLENCHIGELKSSLEEVQSNYEGYLAYARDPDSAEKLWKLTEELIASKS